MWIQPIIDRTQADVDLIRLDPTNSNTKGAYNYTDLNRIENNCEYLMNLLNNTYYYKNPISLIIKTNWNVIDIPTISQFNRIRDNLETLKSCFYAIKTESIIYSNSINYIKANALEKILFDIDFYIKDITRNINLKFNVGLKIVNTKYVDIVPIKFIECIYLKYNVALKLVNTKYSTLIVESEEG